MIPGWKYESRSTVPYLSSLIVACKLANHSIVVSKVLHEDRGDFSKVCGTSGSCKEKTKIPVILEKRDTQILARQFNIHRELRANESLMGAVLNNAGQVKKKSQLKKEECQVFISYHHLVGFWIVPLASS